MIRISFLLLVSVCFGAVNNFRCGADEAASGGANFSSVQTYSAPDGAKGVTAADFNGDGLVDVATANQWARSASIFFGRKNGTFGNRTDLPAGDRPEKLATGDFNADGRADLAVANWSDHNVNVYIQKPEGGFLARGPYAVGTHPNGIMAEDLDGNGYTDIATTSDVITVLYNDASGEFSTRSDYGLDDIGLDLVTADFNRDGLTDIATSLPNVGGVNVIYGHETLGFGGPRWYRYPTDAPSYLTTSDFNHDGIPDLAFSGYSGGGSMVVLQGIGDGRFEVQQEHWEPSFPKGIVSADFNLDGDIDIAAADGGTVWIYYGSGDGNFLYDHALNAEGVFIETLAAVDLNGDGSVDLLGAAGGRGYGHFSVFYNLYTVPEPSSTALLVAIVGAPLLFCPRRWIKNAAFFLAQGRRRRMVENDAKGHKTLVRGANGHGTQPRIVNRLTAECRRCSGAARRPIG